MRLTTRGRYAVTALLDLAMYGEEANVTLSAVAERQCISMAYLEQLFARLRRAGLVESHRGPSGGYRLALPAKEISLARIVDAVNEKMDATRCGGEKNCTADEPCLTHQLWQDLTRHIRTYLETLSLENLARQPHVISVAARQAARSSRSSRQAARLRPF